MSKAADLNKDEYESANGSPEKKIGDTEVLGDEGEESDDYEEIDDEEGGPIAGEEEEEGEGGQQNTLTHLLIGNPNGATAGNEAEYGDEDDEGDGDDDDDEDDDDEDDDEYVEEDDEDNTAHPIPLNKKRSIDEVVDKEASQGSKKIKA